MNDPRRVLLVVAVALGSLVPTVASASYPAGVWALVEKVTPEPDADQPNRVRIDGLFIVAKGTPDFAGYPGYSVPAYGYMYYQCADAELATCKMEWAELAAVAGGEDRCRGWGDNSLPANGTVRTGEPQAMPDAYPISMGVVPGFSPCEALKQWMAEHPPEAATTGEGTSEGTGASSGEFASESSGGTPTGTATSSPTSGAGPNDSTAAETATSEAGTASGASGQADTGSLGGDKGCVCSSGSEPRPLAGLLTIVGLLALRRRGRA